MSRLLDTAAALVAKIRTQALASTLEPGQTPDERRAAWAAIDRLLEPMMEEIHRSEPVLSALEGLRDLPRTATTDDVNAALRAIVVALELEKFPAVVRPAPPAVPGFSRAGDVQLPLGDRDPDPATS